MAREELRLSNQLCFPLWACSRQLTRAYAPLLEPHGLTYTQYVTLMALWEEAPVGMGELGETLWLDSGTLTPLLKKLEARGLVRRRRDAGDERRVRVELTEAGRALEGEVASVPARMACRVGGALTPEEGAQLVGLLRKLIDGLGAQGGRVEHVGASPGPAPTE